jgi:hypothetical protein
LNYEGDPNYTSNWIFCPERYYLDSLPVILYNPAKAESSSMGHYGLHDVDKRGEKSDMDFRSSEGVNESMKMRA